MQHSIGFIGGGNMATSLIGGLIADGHPKERIRVAEPDPKRRSFLATQFGLQAEDSGESFAADVDVVVFAVKPQVMQPVARQLAGAIRRRRPLVISIAAGIRTADLSRWLGGHTAIVRAMPNTPALIQAGATGLYALADVSAGQRGIAESVMRAAGLTCWVNDEALIDAITALSGSGPAYSETARLLTLQTAFGAAKMALESDDPPATLRQRVTSPGGTTERALRVFTDAGLPETIDKALGAAAERAAELARDLGRDAS
jgi:pyrroline-5-carboxylate reductase